MLPTRTPSPACPTAAPTVGTICDASFPTTLLAHWGRDRSRGRIELPELVSAARPVGHRPAPSACSTGACVAPGYRPT